MDWIKEILDKNIDDDGKIDVSKAMAAVNKEFPKQAITKEVFNEKNEDLKAANKLVKDLKKENKDVEKLQDKIDSYEEEVETINAERLEERKTFTLKEKLKESGAKDVDYMLYKMGEVEADEDGNVEDLDNKIKELQEAHTGMFEVEEGQEDTPPGVDDKGFTVFDNGLDDGQEPDPIQQAASEFEQSLGL